jgi:hypothetical protein
MALPDHAQCVTPTMGKFRWKASRHPTFDTTAGLKRGREGCAHGLVSA